MMNGTPVLITLGGYVNVDKYRYVYFLLLLTVYIFILCSNCIIIYIIWIHRNLHEPMYIFIAALSFNSLFYSTAIYPKMFVDVLSHRQSISHSVCLFQSFLFYTFGGSDFLLLSAMAYDRYVSICKPMHYATTMSKTNVSVLLALSWFLPACQVVAIAIFRVKKKMCRFVLAGIFCNNSVNSLYCVRSQMLDSLGVFIFFNIVVVPVLYILFTYTKIIIVVYRRCRRAREKAVETCLPHLAVLFSISCLVVFDVIVDKMEAEIPKRVRLFMMLQVVVYSPLFNPIIYGVKMKEIRIHIMQLLRHLVKKKEFR
ncbi:olfactory receptor 6N2-like [Corythoichthys intestinalis]|uniref:olfactory receptor 6N2-like n=1 Tax=Corythoichthys intestinalis TaxID=161448 RepID=UPI0025A657E1|nr:olfactory receptor 6N2-like [Corythoichthys intestinalis]